jgi:hypothetical protein
MKAAADTVASTSKPAPRGRFGMPRDVWWGFTTSLVVFVLAPFAATLFTLLSLTIPPLGIFMVWFGWPHFMLAYPALVLFKGSILAAYGLTAVQLVLQALLFGWLARRRTIEQQLWLAFVATIALAIAMSIIGSLFGLEGLRVHGE